MKRKQLVSFAVTFVVIAAMLLTFTACGGPQTLEEYFAQDAEAQKTIESMEASGVTADISDNTLTYTYKYDMDFTDDQIEAVKSGIATQMDGMTSTFENLRDTLQEESGIDGIVVKIVYLDKNGNELYSKEY